MHKYFLNQLPTITSDEYTGQINAEIENPLNSLENQSFLKNLTQISPADYSGKELCNICLKHVKESQQALLCDECARWSHRKCNATSMKYYRSHKYISEFPWTCSACQKKDSDEYKPIILSDLLTEDLPDDRSHVVKRKGELVIIHLNCRSAVNKETELEFIIELYKPDIICLSETWYDESLSQNICPNGYHIIRKDRNEQFKHKYKKQHGGGIAVLYREDLIVEYQEKFSDPVEDIMWVKVKTQKSFWLGILYRPHYSEIINEECGESILEKNISKVTEKSSQIILTGDFNIDLRDKDQYDTTTLKNICKAYGMSQYIKKVTRFDKKGKGTTIDHIWATPEADIVKAGTIPGISDHLGTYCKINKHPITKQKPIIKVRNFQKYDAQEFITYTETKINNSAINTCLKNKNVNSATETLLKVINESLEKFAPLKEITLNRKRKGLPWITEEIRELTEEKNQMLLDSYSHGFEKYKKRIKKMTNLINCRKRNEKKRFISEEIEKAGLDVRRLWKLLNMLTGRGKSKKNIEPDNITQNTANEYNKYFATIGTKIQEELNFKKPLKPIPNNKRSELPEFVFKNENATKIKKIIENIKNNVAVGCDNIVRRGPNY